MTSANMVSEADEASPRQGGQYMGELRERMQQAFGPAGAVPTDPAIISGSGAGRGAVLSPTARYAW